MKQSEFCCEPWFVVVKLSPVRIAHILTETDKWCYRICELIQALFTAGIKRRSYFLDNVLCCNVLVLSSVLMTETRLFPHLNSIARVCDAKHTHTHTHTKPQWCVTVQLRPHSAWGAFVRVWVRERVKEKETKRGQGQNDEWEQKEGDK